MNGLIDSNEMYGCLKSSRNAASVADNVYQNQNVFKRVLFVCSAGVLRSATAAHTFSTDPYNWNTRSVGSSIEYALNLPTEQILYWADEIYFMEDMHFQSLISLFSEQRLYKYKEKMFIMNVKDIYSYRESILVDELRRIMDNKEYKKVWDDV